MTSEKKFLPKYAFLVNAGNMDSMVNHYTKVCSNMNVDHTEYLDLLRSIRQMPGVKKAFVRSGLRYDYIMADKDDTFFKELVEYHVSGQLKVAPEHVSEQVLKYMGKPSGDTYNKFVDKFNKITKK